MKVVQIIDSLSTGGKERRLIELVKYFNEFHKDIETHFIILSDSIDFDEIHDFGVTISTIIRRDYSERVVFFKILKELKKIRPDIVHSWIDVGSIHSSLAKMFIKFKFVNGMIASTPELKILSKQWLYSKFSFLFSDVILSNSRSGLEAYKAPLRKSVCIHNGFNFSRIANLDNKEIIRNKLNIKTKYVVGMVASFSVYKDYTTYVNSANIVLEKNKDITFLCIGRGEKRKYIDMVSEANRDRVLFLDNQKDVESIMNICDIGVLSTYSEGISNAIMEFMALGKPVIATGKGGTKEIIKDGSTGYILSQGNPGSMAEKILELIEDPAKMRNMGNESLITITEEFSIEKMCNEIYSVYKKLLK